jgi:hypothetical protein
MLSTGSESGSPTLQSMGEIGLYTSYSAVRQWHKAFIGHRYALGYGCGRGYSSATNLVLNTDPVFVGIVTPSSTEGRCIMNSINYYSPDFTTSSGVWTGIGFTDSTSGPWSTSDSSTYAPNGYAYRSPFGGEYWIHFTSRLPLYREQTAIFVTGINQYNDPCIACPQNVLTLINSSNVDTPSARYTYRITVKTYYANSQAQPSPIFVSNSIRINIIIYDLAPHSASWQMVRDGHTP